MGAMLERVEIKGYKSAYDVSLDLGRLTVLVGANGSGKTSILEAIAGTTAALRGTERQDSVVKRFGVEPNDVQEIVSWQSDRTLIELIADGGRRRGRLKILPREREWFSVATVEDPTSPGKPIGWPTDARLLRLEPDLIARPAVSGEELPIFESSGANAGPVLDSLPRDVLDGLDAELHGVLSDVHAVRAGRKRVPSDGGVGHEPVYRIHGYDVRARHASEGTNLVLGILLALVSTSGPTTILLDDIQRGLHPRAQADVLTAIRGLLSRDPTLQVIATTHSPYLVDELQAEEVAVVVQREGRAYVRSLSDHPDADRWKGELRTGEFWSAVGEDWVVDS